MVDSVVFVLSGINMNKWMLCSIALFAFGLVTTFSSAEETSPCTEISMAARNIMSARQSGVSMSSLIELTKKAPEEVRVAAGKIISDAFEHPRVNDPALKERSVSEFENKWFLSCYKSRK